MRIVFDTLKDKLAAPRLIGLRDEIRWRRAESVRPLVSSCVVLRSTDRDEHAETSRLPSDSLILREPELRRRRCGNDSRCPLWSQGPVQNLKVLGEILRADVLYRS